MDFSLLQKCFRNWLCVQILIDHEEMQWSCLGGKSLLQYVVQWRPSQGRGSLLFHLWQWQYRQSECWCDDDLYAGESEDDGCSCEYLIADHLFTCTALQPRPWQLIFPLKTSVNEEIDNADDDVEKLFFYKFDMSDLREQSLNNLFGGLFKKIFQPFFMIMLWHCLGGLSELWSIKTPPPIVKRLRSTRTQSSCLI